MKSLKVTKHVEWPHVRVAYVHDAAEPDFFGNEYAVIYGGGDQEEAVLNRAALIAAAPDLLAACRLIVKAHPYNSMETCPVCIASRAAEAAIAKAGGAS